MKVDDKKNWSSFWFRIPWRPSGHFRILAAFILCFTWYDFSLSLSVFLFKHQLYPILTLDWGRVGALSTLVWSWCCYVTTERCSTCSYGWWWPRQTGGQDVPVCYSSRESQQFTHTPAHIRTPIACTPCCHHSLPHQECKHIEDASSVNAEYPRLSTSKHILSTLLSNPSRKN